MPASCSLPRWPSMSYLCRDSYAHRCMVYPLLIFLCFNFHWRLASFSEVFIITYPSIVLKSFVALIPVSVFVHRFPHFRCRNSVDFVGISCRWVEFGTELWTSCISCCGRWGLVGARSVRVNLALLAISWMFKGNYLVRNLTYYFLFWCHFGSLRECCIRIRMSVRRWEEGFLNQIRVQSLLRIHNFP